MHKECDKPFELKNFGATCYLNSGIQALTSCPHFIQGIYELNLKINNPENKNLQKLDVFNELLQSMLSGNSRQIISTNYIFADWNKTGQQDSFELLAYVINQVFEGIRREKEDQKIIKKGDLAAWLNVELPLRMKMQYDINCECGNKEKSPLQADIALHVSFSNNKSNIRNRSPEIFNMHNMLRQHFDKELIQDFECGKVGCNVKSAQRQLYLLSPLSNTICLHLQRLHWNGNKMEKINNKVTFCQRIIIKGEYIKPDNSNSSTAISDTYYYLKSVIVHDGWESCGHYTCYKKCKNKWFYTSDTIIREVAPIEVFDCNPYILFYERDDGNDDIIPMIIKDYPYINLFIHAMASCREFVQLFRKATLHNDDFLNLYRDKIDIEFIKMLFYLIDLSDCNAAKSKEFESLIINQFKKNNLLSTAYGFLESMNSKIPLNNLMYVMKAVSSNCMSEKSNWFENLFFLNDKDISVQKLVDKYFELHQTKILPDSCHSSGDAMPLLNTICIICDEGFKKNIFPNSMVTVSTSDTKQGEFSSKKYYLKSVIKKCSFRQEKCLRYVDGTWHEITENRITTCNPRETEFNDNKNIILFYDSIPIEPFHILSPDTKKENKANPSSQSQRGIKPIEIVLPPIIVNINENLNVFIQAISSCTNFIDELNDKIPEGLNLVKDLLYLVNLTKGLEINDENIDEYVRNRWCYGGTTVEELIERIFNGIFKEILKNTDELPSMVLQIPICACESSCLTNPRPFWFIDILANDHESKLQILVDKFFREEKHLNHECYKGCAKSQHITMPKIVMPFSKMICIRLSPDLSNITPLSETLALKSQYWMESSDNKDETYDLKSIIMKDELCCYRKIDDEWYKVTDSESSPIESISRKEYQPLLIFYEPRIYMVLDKYLNYIFPSLQSNKEFVDWLTKIKENDDEKPMIKYFKQRTDSRDYGSKTICREFKLSTYDDIYVLMLEIFEKLAMEIESKQDDYGSFPLQVFIKQNAIAKSEYILDIDIFNESCSIQQLLDKYFQGELISSDNNTINSFKILDRPLPKVLCIRLNIFNGVDNQIRNNNYDVKLTENILVNTYNSSNTKTYFTNHKQYKLMSLIECFGDGTNNCYACYRRIDHDKWECRTKNNIINVEFNEVLQVKPYIIFYQIDNTALINNVDPANFDDNLRLFNFFHSISMCRNYLKNLNKSTRKTEYYSCISSFIRVIYELNKGFGNSKDIFEDSKLKLWCSVNYDSDVNPFIVILSEIFAYIKLDKPTIAIIDVDDKYEYRSESPIIINLKRSLKDIGEPITIQQLLDRYFILYSNKETGNAALHQVIEDKLTSVYGDPPETIGFSFRNFSAVSNKYRIATEIILRNKLCSSNSTTWTSCYKGNNCCRKYSLQSLIDNQSQCYKRMNNQWYRISPCVAVLTPESNIQRLTPQILLYE